MINSVKLWLENDPVIPQLKRLHYETINVSLSDVLHKGIQPCKCGSVVVGHSMPSMIKDILDQEEYRIKELKPLGLNQDIDNHLTGYLSFMSNHFKELMKWTHSNVYFVESLQPKETIEYAKRLLRTQWDRKIVRNILRHRNMSFNDVRRLIKRKDPTITLLKNVDLDERDFSRILDVDDFNDYDMLLVNNAFYQQYFRSIHVLDQITDNYGHLRLVDSISHFTITLDASESTIDYNCHCQDEKVRFTPDVSKDNEERKIAQAFAKQWRIDEGRYCFTTTIDRVEKMIGQDSIRIYFDQLEYEKPEAFPESFAPIADIRIPQYGLDNYFTENSTIPDIKGILQQHGIGVSGRKESLLNKAAQLVELVYLKKEAELDAFFAATRFIFIPFKDKFEKNEQQYQPFPVLDKDSLNQFVLAMYITRHLRGNTILDAGHCNDSYSLVALAKALIHKNIDLDGMFLKME